MTLTINFTYKYHAYHYIVERTLDQYNCLSNDFVDCLPYDEDYIVLRFFDSERHIEFEVNIELDMQQISYVAVTEIEIENGEELETATLSSDDLFPPKLTIR